MSNKVCTSWGHICVGDIITAYRYGFHKVTKIERRFLTKCDISYGAYKNKKEGDEYNPLIYYVMVADEEGNLIKGKAVNHCDYSFCGNMDSYINKKTEELKNTISRLLELKRKYC